MQPPRAVCDGQILHFYFKRQGKRGRWTLLKGEKQMEFFVCCLLTHKVYWGACTFYEVLTEFQDSARPQGANVLTGKMPENMSEPSKCCNGVIHNYCAWEAGRRRNFSRRLGTRLEELVLPTNHYYHICFSLLVKNIWHVFAKINEYLYWIFEDFQVHRLKKKKKSLFCTFSDALVAMETGKIYKRSDRL